MKMIKYEAEDISVWIVRVGENMIRVKKDEYPEFEKKMQIQTDLLNFTGVEVPLNFIEFHCRKYKYFDTFEREEFIESHKVALFFFAYPEFKNLSKLEQKLELPTDTLRKYLTGKQGLAEKWHKPILNHLKSFAQSFLDSN